MSIFQVPITKAGRNIAVESEGFADDVYAAIFAEGLKSFLNRRMSKILTKDLKDEKLAEAQDAAYVIGEENLAKLVEGKLTSRGASKANKVDRTVMTEARRMAKEVVKDTIRANGGKPSHYAASEITKAANALIESDPSYIEKARENIENRATLKPAVDISAMIHESPTLKAKAEERKAERQLSAAKAGKVAPRKRGAATHAGH